MKIAYVIDVMKLIGLKTDISGLGDRHWDSDWGPNWNSPLDSLLLHGEIHYDLDDSNYTPMTDISHLVIFNVTHIKGYFK